MPEISLMYLKRDIEIVRDYNKKRPKLKVIVDLIHALGPKNILKNVFIELELTPTTLKLSETY